MSTEILDQRRSEERTETIKRRIAERTGGRVQTLEVVLIDDRVVIRGTVLCYYIKQLVLQAVLDLIGTGSATRIDLDVQVLCSGRTPIVRR
jgi:hypothetical protein